MRLSRSGPEPDPAEVAVRLLARREHSRRELRLKLEVRGFEEALIASVLEDLEHRGLLSDARFAESYVRSRRERGFGPLRIGAELRERGVDEEHIEHYLDPDDPQWLSRARAIHARRYGAGVPGDRKEQARRARFLTGRGFSTRIALAAIEDEPG